MDSSNRFWSDDFDWEVECVRRGHEDYRVTRLRGEMASLGGLSAVAASPFRRRAESRGYELDFTATEVFTMGTAFKPSGCNCLLNTIEFDTPIGRLEPPLPL